MKITELKIKVKEMATKIEKKPLGKGKDGDFKKKLTQEGEEKEDVYSKNQGDAEAGIDPQKEYLNDMPNDPNESLSEDENKEE